MQSIASQYPKNGGRRLLNFSSKKHKMTESSALRVQMTLKFAKSINDSEDAPEHKIKLVS